MIILFFIVWEAMKNELRLIDLYIICMYCFITVRDYFIVFFCLISEYIEKLLKEDLPKKLTGHPNQPKLPLGGLHVLFSSVVSWLVIYPKLRKKSQFEKLSKFTIIFTQSEDFFPLGPFELSFCKSCNNNTLFPRIISAIE